MQLYIRADRRDGNEPEGAIIDLPVLPRKGDQIEVWVTRPGVAAGSQEHLPGDPFWLDVDQIIFPSYGPVIEVWVTTDTYDVTVLEEIFKSLARGDKP